MTGELPTAATPPGQSGQSGQPGQSDPSEAGNGEASAGSRSELSVDAASTVDRFQLASPDAPVRAGRYAVTGKIGAGGMGAVYDAIDTERETVVALKTLHHMEPSALLRLKAEFRSVADVTHPNLVVLYELVSDRDTWFFTMEHIDGTDFVSYVRGGGGDGFPTAPRMASTLAGLAQLATAPRDVHGHTEGAPDTAAGPVSSPTLTDATIQVGAAASGAQDRSARRSAETSGGPEDEAYGGLENAAPAPRPIEIASAANAERLRDAIAQLVRGVHAVHQHGLLHLDLKPGNVLVDRGGRVVILDFGLVRHTLHQRSSGGDSSAVSGTPAYMAPEQADEGELTEAADWYAVGVMLYQALTGRLPFDGDNFLGVILAKLHTTPTPPSEVAEGVAQDLEDLCLALLRTDPAARPTADVILEVTGASAGLGPRREAPVSPAGAGSSTAAATRLVGREEELAVLEGAWKKARLGATAVVHVSGISGMGKSALVEHFLTHAVAAEALVLRGRCYERESVPYKAFDSLVDELVHHLQGLPEAEVTALLPLHVHELARVFPVLDTVSAVAKTPPRGARTRDPLELRRRAFRGLKDLLARLAASRPLVLYIDDVQWGDWDSARLLVELLSPPDPPSCLLIAAYRSEEASESALLAEYLPLVAASGATEQIELPVVALSRPHAERLARSLLVDEGRADLAAEAGSIAAESGGVPFFVEELARYVASAPAARAAAGASLDEVITSRIGGLPDDLRQLLEVVSVSGSPLAQGVAFEASSLDGDTHQALRILRGAKLLRSRGTGLADAVEVYHGRIRDAVVAGLDGDRRAGWHRSLAESLAQRPDTDPELLATHFHGAGDVGRAGRYAIQAADAAAEALAFGHAAGLYERALAWLSGDPEAGDLDADEARDLRRRLADALVNAGRGAEAAPVYLSCVEGADEALAIELRRRATEEYLSTGHFAEGHAVLRPLLADVGQRFPETPRKALMSVVGNMVKVKFRGTKFTERAAEEVPAAALQQLDVVEAVAKGFASTDPIVGNAFFLRALNLALAAGEPARVARMVANYGLMTVYPGTPGGVKAGRALFDEADAIAARLDDPYTNAFLMLAQGVARLATGEWQRTIDELAACRATLDEQCVGHHWEYAVAFDSGMAALLWKGDLADLHLAALEWGRRCEEAGDRFGLIAANVRGAVGVLTQGDPRRAMATVQQQMARWTETAFTFQHFFALEVQNWCDVYQGRSRPAYERINGVWKRLKSSLLLSIRLIKVNALRLRGATALALAAEDAEARPGLLRAVSKDASVLQRLDRDDARGAAAALRAGVAHLRGQDDDAAKHLDAAISAYEAGDMRMHAAAARRRLGQVRGDEALLAEADAAMLREGVADPARFAVLYAPGW